MLNFEAQLLESSANVVLQKPNILLSKNESFSFHMVLVVLKRFTFSMLNTFISMNCMLVRDLKLFSLGVHACFRHNVVIFGLKNLRIDE